MALKVQDQSSEVSAMACNWPIAEALLGGTAAMRAASTAFLPKWPNEEQASYDNRLATATLFPALTRTVSVMTGKPFAKQLTLGDDVPPKIVGWCDDADLQGNNLHAFSADVMAESLGYGICGVLVDYPRVGPEVKTLQAERSIGARPYLVFIQHQQILGWQATRVNGATVLTQLRIAETAEIPDGEFGTACVNRVRVLTPGKYEVYQESADKKEYVLLSEESGTTTIGVIPFVPFYGKKKAFMCGVSPLLDLAYLNVKHWQSQSDQDTILHVARVPILAMIGAEEGSALTVGASSAVKLPLGAELKFVEHSGAAIAAGEVSLEKLEDQMIQTGAELLVQKPSGDKSATEANNEAEANKSDLQRIVESFEDSLDQVLQLMALWVGEKQGGHASLFKDFGAATLTDASAQLILALQQGGLITKETAIREQQRRGMLAADVVPEEELAAVAEEGPALGMMVDPVTGETVPDPSIDPVTGEPKPGNVASPDDPQGGNSATPTPDFSPLLDAIQALIDKPAPAQAEQAPVDLSPIVEAIKAIAPPVVNVPASADNTETLKALVDAIKAMPAPVVNMPAIQVDAPSIQVDAPSITLPQPAAPVPPPPPPKRQPLAVDFVLDKDGFVIGAREVGADGREINFVTNGDGNVTGARMN